MDPLKQRRGKRPEQELMERGEAWLRSKGWFVRRTHGNAYQSGFPDNFLCHKSYGQRWLDWKIRGHYSITPAQMRDWPQYCDNGSGVWILVDTTEEEYAKLFKKYNWWTYCGLAT